MTAWAYIKDFFSFLSLKKKWHLFFSASYYFQNYFWLFTIGTAIQIVTGKGYLISIFFPAATICFRSFLPNSFPSGPQCLEK